MNTDSKLFKRYTTNLPPLDHVLGGGLVEASVVLLVASPGTGKTSLTLQALTGLGHGCLYASGEETQAQIVQTARRLGAASSQVCMLAERRLEKIFTQAREIDRKSVV